MRDMSSHGAAMRKSTGCTVSLNGRATTAATRIATMAHAQRTGPKVDDHQPSVGGGVVYGSRQIEQMWAAALPPQACCHWRRQPR